MAIGNKTITDLFAEHIGVKQWDSFVRKMITWYYGGFAEVKWCAISCSYMADQLGILDQFGGKEQNTYQLMKNTEAACKKSGKGTFKYAKALKKGDTIRKGTVIFILKSAPPMVYSSTKHTTTAYGDFMYNDQGYFKALGGNQSGEIQVKQYPQKYIYAIFYPQYETHKTLRKGDNGAEVKELQNDLVKLGFGKVTGTKLACRGNFKSNTEAAVKLFQQYTGCCTPDGICGKKTWAMIDKMLAEPLHSAEAMTNVYVRYAPGLEAEKKSKVLDGTVIQYTNIVNGFLYIPKKKGWSKSSYYKL